MSTIRRERDSMGEMEVPAEAYDGAQTARAAGNFQISTAPVLWRLHPVLGLIKKAAAQVNMDLGLLSPELGAAIIRACAGGLPRASTTTSSFSTFSRPAAAPRPT